MRVLNKLIRGRGIISQPVFFLLVFCLLIGCESDHIADPLTPQERKWLTQHDGQISLAIEANYAPFAFIDENGAGKGLSTDYVELIEKKLNFRFKRVRVDSLNEILKMARQKDIDVVNAVTQTPARSEYLLFTKPFVEIPNVIIVRNDQKGSLELDHIKDKKISLVKDYAVTEYLADTYKTLNIDFVPDDLTALLNVSFGRTDAAVVDLATASYFVEQKGIANLRIAGETHYNIKLAIASRKDWPILNQILGKGLSLVGKEESESIKRKWISFGETALFQSRKFWMVVISALSMVFLVVIGAIFWNRALRRLVDLRTVQLQKELSERKRAEEALRGSENNFRDLFDNAPLGYIEYDSEGRIVQANHTYLNLVGYPREEVVGELVWKFYIEEEEARKQVLAKLAGNLPPGRGFIRTFCRKDGSAVPVLAEDRLIKDQWGGIAGIRCAYQDITEREKAEAALYESEEKYRILFNTFPLGITVSDRSGKIVEANDTAAKLLGICRDEHLSRSIDGSEWRIIDPTGAPMPPENYASVRALKENRLVENAEMGIVKSDAETTWISVTASPLPLENYGVVVTYGDITDRKRIEREYQILFREMIDGFAVHEIICNERGEPVDYRFLAVNPTFERQTRLKAEDIIGKTVKEVLPNTEPYWIEIYGRVALTGESITFENYSQELDRYFYVTAFRPSINQFACISVDITERKRSEQALLESEKKYRLLADNARDVIWIRDLELKLTYVSPSIEIFSGYTVEEAMNRNLNEILTPDSAMLAAQTFAEAMQNLESGGNLHAEYTIELEHICKDGRQLWMECKISALKDGRGKVVGMLGVSRDITERREAERALWESEEKFRLTFDSSPDAVNINRLEDGLYLDINHGFTELTGFSREDVVGKTSEEIQIWNDLADRQRLVKALEERGFCENLEACFRRKDGSLTTALMSARIITLQGEPHII